MNATERARRSDSLYYDTQVTNRRALCDMIANRESDLTESKAENAKLRELVRDYIDAPCTTCDCWQDEFRCWNYDGADCGLVARARELGIEVDG